MDIENFKLVFKKALPDFVDFENPGQTYLEQEYNYKKSLSQMAHEIFGAWVNQATDSLAPEEFVSSLRRLLQGKIPGANTVQYLSGWRDNSIFFDEILSDAPQTRQFMSLLHGLLKEAGDPGKTSQTLGMLLDWLRSRDCPPSLTKIFPSFFLFVWSPDHHFFIKPRIFDRFLREIGEKPLGSGYRLTTAEYQRVLDIMQRLRMAISGWRPRDMIDLHSFFWISMNQPDTERLDVRSARESDDEITEDNHAPQVMDRVDLPLNLIFYGPPGTGKTYELERNLVPRFIEENVPVSRQQFIAKVGSNLTWFQTVAMAVLDLQQAKVAEIFAHEVVQARYRAAELRHPLQTIWSTLQLHTVADCPNVKAEKRQDPLVVNRR